MKSILRGGSGMPGRCTLPFESYRRGQYVLPERRRGYGVVQSERQTGRKFEYVSSNSNTAVRSKHILIVQNAAVLFLSR